MAHDLPTQFDVIVVGTGMPECVLAAAYARIGHSVLHIDRNDYYSADWASFNLDGLDRWAASQQAPADDCADCLRHPENDEQVLQSDEKLIQCPLRSSTFTDINIKYHVKDTPTAENDISVESLVNKLSHDLSVSDTTGSSSSSRIDPGTSITDSSHTAQECDISDKSTTSCDTTVIADSVCDVYISVKESKESDVAAGISETEKCQTPEATPSTGSSQSMPGDVKHETDTAEDLPQKQWTREEIKKQWRKFNVDLIPKLLFSRGELVELLISSDVAKYCEFKTVTRVLTLLHGSLEQVPCSRSDVFSNKLVSVIEKRMLMKFITFCLDYQNQTREYQEFVDKPFNEFLKSRKLTPNLQHFVQHAIAMATEGTTTAEGLAKTHKFLTSLGRYGNTAFLWPLYGSGELPQAFARLCAVFGGIYCLRMSASSLIIDQENNRCKGIVTTEGQRVEAKTVILESSYVPECYKQNQETTERRCIARAVVLTDRSVKGEDQNQVSLLHLPCEDDPERPITVLELCSATMACPDDMFMVHLSRVSTGELPERELDFAVQQLLESLQEPDESGDASTTSRSSSEGKPCILWSMYFTMENTSNRSYTPDTPENLIIVPGPGDELHFDDVTKQSQDLFQSLCPDEEFLPKAPSPEELILFGEEPGTTNPGFNEDLAEGNNDTTTTDTSPESAAGGSIIDVVERSKSPTDVTTEVSKSPEEMSKSPEEASMSPEEASILPEEASNSPAEASKSPEEASDSPTDGSMKVGSNPLSEASRTVDESSVTRGKF